MMLTVRMGMMERLKLRAEARCTRERDRKMPISGREK